MFSFSHYRLLALLLLLNGTHTLHAQHFTLDVQSDTLAFLMLTDTVNGGGMISRWQLPYPTYGFCTGDINGDGHDEAIVGVIKATRFNPVKARRLFIYKNVEGRIRPMWLGSKLGGFIDDFRYLSGKIRCLHRSDGDKWHVVDYQWGSFGPTNADIIIENTTHEQARKIFLSP